MASEVLKTPKILCFVEWMFSTAENEHLISNPSVKNLLPANLPNKDDEINKIKFLNRQKEKLKKSNSIASGSKKGSKVDVLQSDQDLNEIYLNL
jgi:hypothetical protein